MTLPAHLFVSDSDGSLYDTRVDDWSRKPALRAVYSRHCRDITNAAELKATLRAGPYAWPGGYPLYFVMSDGESLSYESARGELRQLLDAFQPQGDSQWRVVGCEINYENLDMVCCHSGEPIPSAYGNDTEESES